MRVFEDWGLAIYLAPKCRALPTAPHPDKYMRFYSFCVEVVQTVVKRKFHAVLRFYKVPKVRINKGFSGLSRNYGYNC